LIVQTGGMTANYADCLGWHAECLLAQPDDNATCPVAEAACVLGKMKVQARRLLPLSDRARGCTSAAFSVKQSEVVL
jgi:hypothetical protein